jgi:purine-nucleoside phosphorylase
MADPLATARQAADELHARTGVGRFDVAVVLGSGWKLAAADLTGFVPSAVEGHEGRIRAVEHTGRNVLLFLGRTHLYEGHGVEAVVHGVRTAIAAGAHIVVLTNASGAIAPELEPGEPVLIADHIALTATSPLVGGQFVDLTELYSPRLRDLAREVDPSLREGVYAHWPGPAFETPAEIRMLRTLGADLVGMSTVPEAIAAHALGAGVLAISLPTNRAAGMTGEKLSHEEVGAAGAAAAPRCAALLAGILARL